MLSHTIDSFEGAELRNLVASFLFFGVWGSSMDYWRRQNWKYWRHVYEGFGMVILTLFFLDGWFFFLCCCWECAKLILFVYFLLYLFFYLFTDDQYCWFGYQGQHPCTSFLNKKIEFTRQVQFGNNSIFFRTHLSIKNEAGDTTVVPHLSCCLVLRVR